MKKGVFASVVDPIPVITAWSRKAITVKTVSWGGHRGAMSQEYYVRRMGEFQREAVTASDMGLKTAAFWKMENLSSEFLKHRSAGQSLNDPSLAVEVRPIAHCGMGIAAVEVGEFDARKIGEVIDSFSHPDYRLFALEGLGAMLAVYEKDLFGAMSRAFGRVGLLPLAPLKKPDTLRFVAAFPPEVRRLMGHGYGRLQYFKNHSIVSAIRAVSRSEGLEYVDGVQGIAFAYAMVNNGDLARVFRAGEAIRDDTTAAAFRDGLTYALEFWEWMAPGFLDGFEARTAFQKELALRAAQEVGEDRSRGPLAAFAVGAQRAAQRSGGSAPISQRFPAAKRGIEIPVPASPSS